MIEILPNWHPIFVHFTVSLFTVSTFFYFLTAFTTRLKINHEFLVVARWCLWLSALITVGTITAGLLAYYTVVHDEPSHVAMFDHRNWALATFVVILGLTIWSWLRHRSQQAPNVLFLFGTLVGLGLLMVTAWRGGELVYRHGLGVLSLPQASEKNHQHDHGVQNQRPLDVEVLKKEKAHPHPNLEHSHEE